jgi:LacI family transcriptional regulator, xylobiose transport system transcriptional regulator
MDSVGQSGMMKHMLTEQLHLPHITALADKVVTDIRHRGLSVGDRYLTTAEVGRMLGVQKAMANKAMRHLAEQGVLISRQRAGTFIGPGLKRHKRSKVRTIYVLLPAGDPSATRWAFQPFIAGVRSVLPEINVQFTFVPENDPLGYIEELIAGQRAAGQFAGVVAVSCSPEVYRYLAELCEPAVVYGSLYSSDLPIASVDLDNRQSGRLLTQYLVDRGHRRMAVLMTGAGLPGHNTFIDGIGDVLTTAALPANALIHRLIRNDLQALQSTAKELLEGPDPPTAVITRGSIQAQAVASVASSLGLAVPGDLEIVFDHEDQTTPHINMASYPRVAPKSSFVDIAAVIAEVLKEVSEGASSPPKRVLIPVEFCKSERIPTQSFDSYSSENINGNGANS